MTDHSQPSKAAPEEALSSPVNASDPLADLVERFSRRLLAKLRLAEANGRSGWDRDDWEKECQQGLLRHIDKGDPRDVAAYCAFMDHHGWITVPQASAIPAQGATAARQYVENAIASFVGDPPDNQFQKGFLAALEVVRDEAFTLPSTKQTSHDPQGVISDGADKAPNSEMLGRQPRGESLPSTEREGE